MSSSPEDAPPKGRGRKVLTWIASALVGYLLGIGCGIAFTPAEVVLAGVNLLPWYLLFSVVLFLIIVFQQYIDLLAIWWVGAFVLIPLACELGIYFGKKKALRRFRPAWYAFLVGFFGTLGIFFAGAQSI